ncbi:MAG: sugar ABC transporter substrate-binding protein [Chloroflexi bacterium]|nr:sugar ABC transporter substrate-binding protein [Chloroflexota bacterium]
MTQVELARRDRLSRRHVLGLLTCAVAGDTLLASCGTARGHSISPAPGTAEVSSASATATRTTGASPKVSARATAAASPVPIARAGSLTVLSDVDVKGLPLLTKVIDRWNQANPQARASLQGVTGQQYTTKVETMAAGGALTDVFALSGNDLPRLAGSGVPAKLDTFLQRDHYDVSDFVPLPRQRMRWKGAAVALPRGFSNQCIYWNVDMFDRMAVTYPPQTWNASGWDFAAFLDTAQKLTKGAGAGAQYGFTIETGFVGGWGQWLYANGGHVFDPAFQHCLVSQPTPVQALQFMQDLIVKYKVAPTPATLASEDPQMLFFSGRLAMLFAPVASVAYYRQAKFKWDFATTPKGNGPRVTTAAAGVYWCMNAHTHQPDSTWRLLSFLASPTSELELANTYFPARESVLQEIAKLDPGLPPAHRQVGIEGQKLARAFRATPYYEQLNSIFTKQFAYLWDGSRSVQTVTSKTVGLVNGFLADHRSG